MSMPGKQAVVFGAGKIARGFIAHLLALSGYAVTFVEKSPELVAALRRRGRYTVEIMGAPEKSMVIEGFGVLACGETEAIAARVAAASVIFVSIGGPNLPEMAPLLAEGLRRRTEGVNVILCENYFQPGQWLRRLIAERLAPVEAQWCAKNVGVVETMVLRSVIEPPPDLQHRDPLALKAQDMWELPADKQAFVGPVPSILGLAPKENFQGGLVRKLFTYNAINAVISYIGRLKGYELLSDAANDPQLEAVARKLPPRFAGNSALTRRTSGASRNPPSPSTRGVKSSIPSSATRAIPCASWGGTTGWWVPPAWRWNTALRPPLSVPASPPRCVMIARTTPLPSACSKSSATAAWPRPCDRFAASSLRVRLAS